MFLKIGIIGGTGMYNPDLLKEAKEIKVHTPYGATSDLLTTGVFMGKEIVVLPRHGLRHTVPPHGINFRANIYALKSLGVDRIIATAAVGSLKERFKAGDVVIPDQFIDFGKENTTFYDAGKLYHVSLADPFCSQMRDMLNKITKDLGIASHDRGTYLRISGPQFSTRAASRMYAQFGDIIGMTCVPEAILAREKEMCLAVIATITDYDSFMDKPVDFKEIAEVMKKNAHNTKNIIAEAIKRMPQERVCVCKDALGAAEVE